jgi:hypothetical protein
MNILFLDNKSSELADEESRILSRLKQGLLKIGGIREVWAPQLADVILIQEKFSYKDFRYISKLLRDPVLARYTEKVYTINSDDCATGLLRGLYTSLPRSRFNPRIHAAIPYMHYPNELIFSNRCEKMIPSYLGSWRGNTKSNAIRLKMISALKSSPDFCLETTDSWLNHQMDEKKTYADLMLNAKFSLCPAGWAPVSFRIYESMALGRCPVILADEFVAPVGPKWSDFALFYPEKRIFGLPAFLREREHLYEEWGERALHAWNEFFSDGPVQDYMVQRLLALIHDAPVTTKGLEIKRWRSLALYWSNSWTLPQRIMNKASKLSRVIATN